MTRLFAILMLTATMVTAQPSPPADLRPLGPETGCTDNATGELGQCMLAFSPSTGIWMMFRQRGTLMFLRNKPHPTLPYVDVWVHPRFSSL